MWLVLWFHCVFILIDVLCVQYMPLVQEWVWPIGFFLRAKLKAAQMLESKRPGIFTETVNFIKSTLSAHHQHVFYSEWRGLPELTNQDGAVISIPFYCTNLYLFFCVILHLLLFNLIAYFNCYNLPVCVRPVCSVIL